jgi:hypothetical protein
MFISKEQEPTQYYDAIKNEKWCKAIREELNVFKKKYNLSNYSITKG